MINQLLKKKKKNRLCRLVNVDANMNVSIKQDTSSNRVTYLCFIQKKIIKEITTL